MLKINTKIFENSYLKDVRARAFQAELARPACLTHRSDFVMTSRRC